MYIHHGVANHGGNFMSELLQLSPAGVWRLFDLICATPHPSGHEELLASKLTEEAEKGGLKVLRDTFGNMRIEKKADPGMENKPSFLLQAHLDMVPQKAPGFEFDFRKDSLPVTVEGNRVHCQNKTTLGADDGIGLALALDLLLDKEFCSGPLACIFTREEEIGLNGARALSPEFLKGDYLINLDSSEDFICAGCAGGVETYGTFTPRFRNAPSGNHFLLSIEGLTGGHSGEEIHKGRGNAHKFMAAFLASLGENVAVSSLSGGSVVNAISRESFAKIVTPLSGEELEKAADSFAEKLRPTFQAEKDFGFCIRETSKMETVWEKEFQNILLTVINELPNGVLEFSRELNATQWSCNLGVIREEADGGLTLGLHPRSFDDAQWRELSRRICSIMELGGAKTKELTPYPGWKYDPDSPLIPAARKIYKEMTGKTLKVTAIHAGLETGLICEKNPALKLLAIGASYHKLHTTEEYLEVDSVPLTAKWLRSIIRSF